MLLEKKYIYAVVNKVKCEDKQHIYICHDMNILLNKVN